MTPVTSSESELVGELLAVIEGLSEVLSNETEQLSKTLAELRPLVSTVNPADFIQLVADRTGYMAELVAEHTHESDGRIENIAELADPGSFTRALASTGPAYEAIQHVGEAAFTEAAMQAATAQVRNGLPLRAEIDVVGYLGRKPDPGAARS